MNTNRKNKTVVAIISETMLIFGLGFLIGVGVMGIYHESRSHDAPIQGHVVTQSDMHISNLRYEPLARTIEIKYDGELTLYANNDKYVVIHPDGRAEYVNGCTPDEAANAFWGMVRYLYAQHIHELLHRTNL